MAHLNGVWLIDAPASALNNQGGIEGGRTDNVVGVKYIRTKQGAFPYVSAQAFRYWLRNTLTDDDNWKMSPIYREQKIAYTDSNPITWWDDDLLGYMRAASKKKDAKEARDADTFENATPTDTDLTRVSPLRIGTLVSIAPIILTEDFGVMARQDADAGDVLSGQHVAINPVPHEHQFYQATLKGLFDLDLYACGTFWRRWKTGYRNLDTARIAQAEKQELETVEDGAAYRLPREARVQRVRALLDGLSRLEGGAKQTLHYTPVGPSLVVCAVMRGGVSPFQHAVGADRAGQPVVKAEVLIEGAQVWNDQLLSPIYLGWKRGYLDESRAAVEAALAEAGLEIVTGDPRVVFQRLSNDLAAHPEWMD